MGNVKWSIEADYFQACNCDYGCPCEFEAPPTRGNCQGIGIWRINRGQYGEVKLDGLCMAFIIDFPGPIHKGNGTGVYLIDQKADPKQREALSTIAHGKAGGMPFEIFAMVIAKVLEPQFVPFEFNLNGKNSSARAGSAASMAFEPIRNPVTNEPESVAVEHATGFIFKRGECVSAKECRASLGELNFSWPDKAGFVAQIKYAN